MVSVVHQHGLEDSCSFFLNSKVAVSDSVTKGRYRAAMAAKHMQNFSEQGIPKRREGGGRPFRTNSQHLDAAPNNLLDV